MKPSHSLLFLSALALLTACSAPKKVTYLQDVDVIPTEILTQHQPVSDPILGPGDLLNIRVYSSDMAAVAPFNKGQYITPEGGIGYAQTTTSQTAGNSITNQTEYYLVNVNGDIDFPVLGTIHVTGKTKQALAEEIRDDIFPKYVRQAPTVEVRLMNFKVTVLGQVKTPGQYTATNERMNVLEALAMAGDLDIRGERENILLYRTNSDGTREVHRLNLNDKNLLLSPYFNLQQNDFIYVEPNRSAKQNAWQLHQGWTTAITVVSGISSVAGLVIGIINLTDNK